VQDRALDHSLYHPSRLNSRLDVIQHYSISLTGHNGIMQLYSLGSTSLQLLEYASQVRSSRFSGLKARLVDVIGGGSPE